MLGDPPPDPIPPAAGTTHREVDVATSNALYLAAVRAAPTSVLAPYLRTRCPECDVHPSPAHDDPDHPHAFEVRGDIAYVVLGCEGYALIDPSVVGLDRGLWQHFD